MSVFWLKTGVCNLPGQLDNFLNLLACIHFAHRKYLETGRTCKGDWPNFINQFSQLASGQNCPLVLIKDNMLSTEKGSRRCSFIPAAVLKTQHRSQLRRKHRTRANRFRTSEARSFVFFQGFCCQLLRVARKEKHSSDD